MHLVFFSQKDLVKPTGIHWHSFGFQQELLSNVCFQPKIKEIIVPNKTMVPVECSRDLQITTCVGSKNYKINVNNVLYIYFFLCAKPDIQLTISE